MKKLILFAATATLMASCANDDILDSGDKNSKEVPILLSADRQNITRATNLEKNLHYNFGAWAQKTKTDGAQTVMNNYLVGWSDNSKTGYYVGNLTTTYAGEAGNTSDHTSPWFYEGLGNEEYTYTSNAGFYTKNDAAYMSVNGKQYLRYWDLAYTSTYFYCYSPYQASGVSIDMAANGTATMTFTGTTIRDGYDKTPNTAYNSFDRSLAEFMVGGYKATNSALADVTIPFKHMGAQLFIRFHEDVPGYKVEILDLSGDNGTMKDGSSEDQRTGIQATPSEKQTEGSTPPYKLGEYYTTSGASVSFNNAAEPTATAVYTDATKVSTNLMFYAPSTAAADYSSAQIPDGYAANLADFAGLNSTAHKTIKETVTTGTQAYSWSPTIYYPVAQPTGQKTGFNFHVTYRLIAEDNKEVITIHNAEVFVPETYTTWAANTRYIYTFKITRNSSGTTSPSTTIDPADPIPHLQNALYPIVFDACTIEDYTENESKHEINPAPQP